MDAVGVHHPEHARAEQRRGEQRDRVTPDPPRVAEQQPHRERGDGEREQPKRGDVADAELAIAP